MKISKNHVSIILEIKGFTIFNLYFEPKLLQESIRYSYSNRMGFWVILLEKWFTF